MGRYGPDEHKGYTFAVAKGEPNQPLTEVEEELYSYIHKLEAAIERLEEKVLTDEDKQPRE